jgi:uncharacterized membrane protein (DUF485 family)
MDRLGSTPVISDERWLSAQDSADFSALRRRLYRFVFPMSGFFLVWYLTYVLLADYAPGLMSIRLSGNVTVGLVLGLSQFVSTFVITTLYVRFAERQLDPLAARIKLRVEGGSL